MIIVCKKNIVQTNYKLCYFLIITCFSAVQSQLQQGYSNDENVELVQKNHMCRASWQWLCENNEECIAKYDVCDGIAQCSDHSDEKNCLKQYHQNQVILKTNKPVIFETTSTNTKTSLPTTKVAKNNLTYNNLKIKYVFSGFFIFFFVAIVTHMIIKKRRQKNQYRRCFRKGESLLDDEDDLLISQMYT